MTLEAHDLAGARGYAKLFGGLSFRVDAGRALAVTGANGSGKTTLLRILAGLSAPSSGAVRWNGDAMAPFDPRLREAVVFHGHLHALKDELTTLENLASLVALVWPQQILVSKPLNVLSNSLATWHVGTSLTSRHLTRPEYCRK